MDTKLSGRAAERQLVQALGPFGLAAVIVNIIVGAGIFAMPSRLFERLGPSAPLAFVLGALAIIPISMCFAAAGSRAATTGGPYTYGRAAFGPLIGFVAGSLMWICNVASSGGVAAALMDQLQAFIPVVGTETGRRVAIVLVYVLLLALNLFGIKLGSRAINVLAGLKLTPLFVLAIIGMAFVDWSQVSFTRWPAWAAMGPAMILVIFAYSGIETALIPSGEVQDPSRNVPRATLMGTLLVVILYVSLQIVTQGMLKADLAGTRTPIADAAGVLLPIARTALLLTACVSMLGFLMGNLLASSRLLFALGRDGYLPKALGSLDSRYHVPRTALILHAIGGTLLALGGNFESLATMSGGANCMVYALVCAAAWKLQASNVQEHGTPFRLPLGPLVPLISIGIMAAILLTLPLTEWKAIATWLAALIVLYFGLHMARRSTRTPVN